MLKALLKKTDDVVMEFFEKPQSSLARLVAETAHKEAVQREKSKQKVKDGKHGAEGKPRKEHRPKGRPGQDDAMQVDGAEGPGEVPVGEKRHRVNEAKMKVVKKEEVEQILRAKHGEAEGMGRRVDKGKARAMDVGEEPRGATGEITAHKRSATKKRAVKSKATVGSDTDEGRSPTVDEQAMKVVKQEEFEEMMGARDTGREGAKRRTDKGKGRAMEIDEERVLAKEITVRKKRVVESGADAEASREGVAGPSKVGRVNGTTRVNAEMITDKA